MKPRIDKHSIHKYNYQLTGKDAIIEELHWFLNDQLSCDDEDPDFIIRESAEDVYNFISKNTLKHISVLEQKSTKLAEALEMAISGVAPMNMVHAKRVLKEYNDDN